MQIAVGAIWNAGTIWANWIADGTIWATRIARRVLTLPAGEPQQIAAHAPGIDLTTR
jgi:hypothetical protein